MTFTHRVAMTMKIILVRLVNTSLSNMIKTSQEYCVESIHFSNENGGKINNRYMTRHLSL